MLYHFVNDDQYEDICQFHNAKSFKVLQMMVQYIGSKMVQSLQMIGLSSKKVTTVLLRLCGLSQGVQNSVYGQFLSFARSTTVVIRDHAFV